MFLKKNEKTGDQFKDRLVRKVENTTWKRLKVVAATLGMTLGQTIDHLIKYYIGKHNG